MTDLIDKLRTARAAGAEAGVELAELPGDLASAYAMAFADPRPAAAWKIGGANPWSRKVFSNTEVFFGALFAEEVFVETATVAVGGLNAPLAEPEIMLEIADPLVDRPEAAFSRMGTGFEIPATVLPADCKSVLTGQVADRAGAGALWIGATGPFDAAPFDTPFTSRFLHNGDIPVDGRSDNVLGGPLGAAMEFLTLARRYGATLEAGQWIATGGLNPAVGIEPGDRLGFAALGRQVVLEIV